MQGNNNIENLFRTELSDVNISPSNDNWSAINDRLDTSTLENLFKNNFSEHTVNPSPSTWQAITSQMPKASILQFNLNAFSVLTASAIVAAVVSLVFFIDPFTNNKEEIKENKTLETVTPIQLENISSITPEEELLETDKIPLSDETQIEKNVGGNSNNSSNKTFAQPILSNNQGVPIIDNEEKKKGDNSSKTNKTDIQANELIKGNDNLSDVTPKVNKNNIANVQFIDTLIVFDTIQYYDTLLVAKIPKKSNTSKFWSVSPHVSLFSSNPEHQSTDKTSSDLSNLYNQTNSNQLSYSFGLGVNYDYKNWRISSGLDYTIIQEEFKYETQEIETRPVTKYTLLENGFYKKIIENITHVYDPKYMIEYDSIPVNYTVHKEDYGSYTVIDTVWRYRVDTNVVHISDSSEVIKYDTIRVATYDTTYYNSIDTNVYYSYYDNVNKYTYIDIPLSLSYTFKAGKFNIRPTIGAVFGIMLNAKGKGIDIKDKNEVYNLQEADLPFMNIQVSMLIALGLEYKIQDNMSLLLQPFYRRSLSSVYDKNRSPYIDKRFMGFGVNAGLNIYF